MNFLPFKKKRTKTKMSDGDKLVEALTLDSVNQSESHKYLLSTIIPDLITALGELSMERFNIVFFFLIYFCVLYVCARVQSKKNHTPQEWVCVFFSRADPLPSAIFFCFNPPTTPVPTAKRTKQNKN